MSGIPAFLLGDGAAVNAEAEAGGLLETSYGEVVVDGNGRISSRTVYVDNTKADKIVEFVYSRNAAGQVTSYTVEAFDPVNPADSLYTTTITITRDAAGRYESEERVKV